MNATRGPRAHRALLVIAIATMSITTVAPVSAAPRHKASSWTLQPQYTAVYDWSQCDDGGGSATCTATSSSANTGIGEASATLRPTALVATGRAEGRGGPGSSHRLVRPVEVVRYRFVFDDVTGSSSTSPASTYDLSARGVVAGHVWHPGCSACKTTNYVTVTDADPLSPTPSSVTAQSVTVELEMRNPNGPVPAGTITAIGFFLADIGPYATQPKFTASGEANIEGRLSRIEIASASS